MICYYYCCLALKVGAPVLGCSNIVSGAVAERVKFPSYIVVACLLSGLIYPIFGHWAWNGAQMGR
ncbi:MAG: hypothetical protein AAF408_13180 [Pseudomonadota bacterium]